MEEEPLSAGPKTTALYESEFCMLISLGAASLKRELQMENGVVASELPPPKPRPAILVVDEETGKIKKKMSAPDCLWDLDSDQHDMLMSHYGFIFRFVKYAGLYIPVHKENDKHPVVYYIRWLFLGVVTALASYQTIRSLLYILFRADYSAMTALTISMLTCMLTWSFQSILSIFFCIHWQRKNYFGDIFHLTHKVNRSACALEAKSWIYFVMKFAGALTALVVIVCIFTIVAVEAGLSEYFMLDVRALNVYGNEKLIPLTIIIFTYTFFIWVCCMTEFILSTIVAYFESEYFNRQLATVGKNGRDTAEELLEFYLKHCLLADVIYALDRTFEVYTFVMLGSNIPTTIFSLLAFFINLRISWYAAAFTFPSVMVCMITLVGLTAVPAKLHSSVTKIEKILYTNKYIWAPFCEKTYQIAQVFIAHVNQTDLGVSVWGFAVVSKPLILTTVSLTITYLSFLLQMKSSFVPSRVANSTAATF
uniref:Gustatory receptor n=2 Tax=Steinernema glaseri TaxID=37863 RepID=A0A1I7YQG2_9BILA